MGKTGLIDSSTARELFAELIDHSWQSEKLPHSNEFLSVKNYLIDLLINFLRDERTIGGMAKLPDERTALNEPYLFVTLYENILTGGHEANLKIKRVGDTSLLVASIFSQRHRKFRRILDRNHYTKTAATAYLILYDRIIQKVGEAIIFGTLARGAPTFVRVLTAAFKGRLSDLQPDAIINAWKRYTSADLDWLRSQGVYIPETKIIQ